MWMLLPLLVHFAAAFPANWNGTTSCPRDALYKSLVEDGGEFCSSVLESNHCGGGYSTPTEYVSYNQTRIASYCECILTSTDAMVTTTNTSGETTKGGAITVTYPDSWTTSEEITASLEGRPGPRRSYETTTTESSKSISGSGNQTRPASSSFSEATEGFSRTSPYTNTTGPATGTLSEGLTKSTDSWNSTIPESLTITRGPISLTFSRAQNQTSDIWSTLSLTRSGNQTQTLQSNTGVTSQPASDTREPGMTRSVAVGNTTSGSLPRPFPGNSTSSPSEGNTGDVPRPTGISTSTFAGWNSSISVPTISISRTGTFVPFPSVPLPTISIPTDSGISSESGSVVPSWNGTTSASRGNGSVPTISISRTGTFVPFPTFPFPNGSSPTGVGSTSSSSLVPSRNTTTAFPGGNVSIPTISISRTGTFVPFPTLSLSSNSLSTDIRSTSSSSTVLGWNSSAPPSGGDISIPTISISRTGTSVPFPTLPLPSESLPSVSDGVTGSTRSSIAIPSWNSTSSPSGGNISVPTISVSRTGISVPFPTVPFPSISLPTVSEVTPSSTRSDSVVPSLNVTNSLSASTGSVPNVSSSESGPVISLPTDSEVLPSITRSGDIGWNITSSISGVVSLPTNSLPTSEIPIPFPSLSLPTDSFTVPTETESGSVVPGGNTTVSAPGSIGSVTSPSSPVPTASTATAPTSGGISNGSASPGSNATATGVPEFPAANFTHVTRTAALSQETCHTLAGDPQGDSTRRALLYNARLREENVSIPIPYIESVEFESDGLNPLYLTVRDEEGGSYFVDISRRGQLSVVDPAGYLVTLDAEGIHFSGSNCTYDISITIDDMYEQIADLAGVQCAALKRQKRAEDLNFSQVLYLHDQCGNVIDRSLRQYPQLLVGDTVCADVAVDEETGRWDFDCTFPGSESGSMRCQWAIKNSVIDFITTDPFGGSCPDLSTVVTTLEESAQDIVDPSELRKDLVNQGLRTERAREEADAAVLAYTRLWAALRAFFSKSTESTTGALEEYIDVYNTHRSFENDICQSLHEGEIPLNLTLIAGATHIPAITTLNWAPESTRPYNITVQDSSRIACCPNGSIAEGEGDTCAYPREAVIQGTGCVCGKSVGGVGIAFEWTECGNYAGSCQADGDCKDGYLCLTGSCCGGGVCVDAYACSENGTELVQFDGVF